MGVKRFWQSAAGRWLPVLIWMGMIFIVSDQAKEDIPSFGFWDTLLKKGAHFLAYALLAWLVWRVAGEWKRPFLYAFVITAVYAMSDEYHQSFIPGRHGQWLDVLIDSAGGLTALLHLRWRLAVGE